MHSVQSPGGVWAAEGVGQGRQRVDLWLAVRGMAYLSSSHYGQVGHNLGSSGYTERKLAAVRRIK